MLTETVDEMGGCLCVYVPIALTKCRPHHFRNFVTISEFVYLSGLVCPASKPWGIVYDILKFSTNVFSANISWRAPNNTYEREVTKYVVSIKEESTEIQSVMSYVSCLPSLFICVYNA